MDDTPISPFEYKRRDTSTVLNIGGRNVPRVVADFSSRDEITAASLFAVGYNYSVPLDKWNLGDQACDFIYVGNRTLDFDIPGTLGVICDAEAWKPDAVRTYPQWTTTQWLQAENKHPELNFIQASLSELSGSLTDSVANDATAVLVITTNNEAGMPEQRRLFFELLNRACNTPVIIKRTYRDLEESHFQLYSATDLGGLFIDGLGDGIWLDAPGCGSPKMVNQTAFGILQATRTRISKTEYISCPSCGRTLFDLQETTAKIRSRTDHLKGVKIGIMGCIVNGPGEMADADYGYVGTGVGKITLYKEKTVVKRNVPAAEAVDELIELIREHGDWVEPG